MTPRLKVLVLVLSLVLSLGMTACAKKSSSGTPGQPTGQSLINAARDASAALQGALIAAQKQWQTTCQADQSQQTCQLINRGISGQNALITAEEAFCGWNPANPPPPNNKCTPVSSAQEGLQSALANAQQLASEIKGIITQPTQPAQGATP
jgi:hypothetical protein